MANTFTFANQSLTDADIYGGISYICDLNTGDEFSIGNTASACVKFVTDKQVPIYTKDQTNGYFEWVQDLVSRGTYFVTECVKVNGSWYSVTAYDAMILLETSITALSLSYPLTVSVAASAIAAYIGCTVSGTIYNGTMACDALDDTTTIRELLGWVAEASGASVKIDAADHIAFLYYAASGITVTASDYKEDGLDVADYTCAAIDNVTILDMAGMTHATAGAGTNSLFIQGNPFMYEATNTEAAVILGLVDSFVYAPFTCEMFDENGLDVGMTATFGTVTTLVMHIESSEEGAVASAVGSDSRAELNKDLDVMVNEALTTATSLSQHFWYTASGSEAGAHIAEVDKATFESNPQGGNLLSNSQGVFVREGDMILAEMTRDGFDAKTYDANDNEVTIAHLGYGEGNGGAVAPYYILGQELASAPAWDSSAVYKNGEVVEYNGKLYMAWPDASAGQWSGHFQLIPGNYSLVEGIDNAVSDTCGHAEGRDNRVSGAYGHAEGRYCVAGHGHTHAQNLGTKALSRNQTALGKYNEEDSSEKYAVIVGNGTADNARSNALAVKWNGDVETSGKVIAQGHSTEIGWADSGASLVGTIATGNTMTQIGNAVTLDAGTWILIGNVVFPANANGSRCVEWRQGTETSIGSSRVIVGAASSGFATRVQSIAIVTLAAQTNMYLYGYMHTGTAGTTVTVPCRYQVIRIA